MRRVQGLRDDMPPNALPAPHREGPVGRTEGVVALAAAAAKRKARGRERPRGGRPARERVGRGLAAAALAAMAAFACNGGRPAGEPRGASRAATAADTLRGIVAVVGAEPLGRVVLRPAGGGAEVELVGPQREALARVAGAEVVAVGRPTSGTTPGPALEAVSFTVTAVDGQPAVDGRLEREAGRLVLVTADGRRIPLVRPPAALEAWVGARVWVAGPLDREPQAFGMIEPRA
ncbi:MAG TPA: hypothetical protein VF192_07555 [Longimicrobiales bacterium]